jgi:DNA invertase Pin-like site-specific DNA recombinase
MTNSDLITPQHLARKALIYIRQSSPHQVLSNQESRRLQLALHQRARTLGWLAPQVETVDDGAGSATSVHFRRGFQELAAQVALGQVGIIFSYDVTRLSRNCSDWFPLLDVCAWQHCLIGDTDGIYDPGSANGRLLLGLKGQLSEFELHTLHSRLTAGLLNKAQRGELVQPLPVGLERDRAGHVHKTPNAEVQTRLELVFSTFLQRRSVGGVLRLLNEQTLLLPRRDRWGAIVWRVPTLAALVKILRNPAYGGAFVYGRTQTTHPQGPGGPAHVTGLPRDQWRVWLPDRYPAYVSWSTFEQIQALLADNYAAYTRNSARGVARRGPAVLQGLLYCGRCGHKLSIEYHRGPHYVCVALHNQSGGRVPVCQHLSAGPVDAAVVAAFWAVLAPVELDAYTQAVERHQATQAALEQAQRQQAERLRYEAALAERQFARVDPDNRLVAAELEKRWEAALVALQAAEAATPVGPPAGALEELAPELQAAFRAIGTHLPGLWQAGRIAPPHQKALLRCLIEKVVVARSQPDEVQARIVWQGGATTTLAIGMPVKALRNVTGATRMEEIICARSAEGASDTEIAAELTAAGYRSPMAARVLATTVQSIRLRHGILQKGSQSHPRRIAGYLTVAQVGARLTVPLHWIYDRIRNGRIVIAKDPRTGLYLFPDDAATLAQLQALKEEDAQRVNPGELGNNSAEEGAACAR